jgi:integrase
MQFDYTALNKSYYKEFILTLKRQNLRQHSLERYFLVFNQLNRLFASKDWKELTTADIDKYFFFLQGKLISEMSKNFYWIRFRRFINWLCPQIDLSVYRMNYREHRIISPGELLTREEVKSLIAVAENYRDAAMIALQYDAGCRPQEIRNLNRNDVVFDENGFLVIFRGSKGERKIRVVTTIHSDQYLKEFLALNPKQYPFSMTPENYIKIFKGLSLKAGIKKNASPYSLRHSRVTHLSTLMTETVQCAYFGWIQGSDMPKVYNHTTSEDVEKRLIEINAMLALFK